MLKKWILLLVIILVAGLTLPVEATQYNPAWAHNYGFLYPDTPPKDTRLQATNASNFQSIVGYDAYVLPDSSAYVGYTSIKDDAVFFFIGHGGRGRLGFYNGTLSLLVAEDTGYYIPEDHFYLSSMSTELQDLLLAVYVSCHSAANDPLYGNLRSMTHQKGADNVIGFGSTINYYQCKYWSDRFWYRCLYGQGGNPQKIRDAAVSAKYDVLAKYGSFGGIDTMIGTYRIPNDYLNPARYGAV